MLDHAPLLSLQGVRIPSNARWCLLVANPDIHQGTTGLVLAATVLHTVAVVHLTRQQQSAGNGVALPASLSTEVGGLSTAPQQVDKRLDSVVTHG